IPPRGAVLHAIAGDLDAKILEFFLKEASEKFGRRDHECRIKQNILCCLQSFCHEITGEFRTQALTSSAAFRSLTEGILRGNKSIFRTNEKKICQCYDVRYVEKR